MIIDNIQLHNVAELLDTPTGPQQLLSRLPNTLRLQLNDYARDYSLQPTGSELRFNLEGDTATISLQCPEGAALIELYQGSFSHGWQIVTPTTTEIVIEKTEQLTYLSEMAAQDKLPFDSALTRIRLPYNQQVKLIGVEGDLSPPRPDQTPSQTYLAYGSSITHGYTGIRPTDPYPQQVAAQLGLDLLNLGLAGGAHLEPEIVHHIANRTDWHIATLELGINIINHIDAAEFERRVDYFLSTLAQHHSDKPIFCIDLFTCNLDYENDPEIDRFREVVQRVTRRINAPKMVYLSGRELLTSKRGLTSDLLHPSASGLSEIAQNLAQQMQVRMKTNEPTN